MHKKLLVMFCLATTFLGLIVAAPDAWGGNEKQRAKKHFQAGIALLEVKNYTGAAKEFEASVAIYPGKNSYFNLANCYMRLQRYEEAIETIEKLKKSYGDKLKGSWAEEISTFEKNLENMVVRLEIGVNIDGAIVELNGEEIGKTPLGKKLTIRRGKYEVSVRHVGYEPQKREVDLAKVKEKILEFSLVERPQIEIEELVEPSPVEEEEQEIVEEKPKRLWTWVSYGVGGAAGVAAIVTGVIQLSIAAELKKQSSSEGGLAPEYSDELATATNLGIATDVLVGVAVAGIAAGTFLFFWEGKKHSDDENEISIVAPSINPNGAGLVFAHSF